MKDYNKAVSYLAANLVNSEFPNKGPQHAAIVLTNLLRSAKQEFRIFSGTFNGDVTRDRHFMKELDNFLLSGKKFYLFLEEIPGDDEMSPALRKIIDYSKNPALNILYKKATPDFMDELKTRFISGNAYHFAIADDRGFRVETDKEEYKAICNFNDEDISSKLKNAFDKYFFN